MSMYRMKDIEYKVKDRTLISLQALELEESEVLGVMGPNGAGKSTLLKLMALLEEPTMGTIHYREKQIYPGTISLDLRRQMATVFQHAFLLDTTVYNNIAVGLKIRKVPKAERRRRIDYWLERFRISHLEKRHAHTLSGGEAQRVSLARALVLEPDILFLDEPFSALDFPTKLELLKDLKQVISQTKVTTVFVSHDLMEIKYLADRLLILMNGEIAQLGSTRDVISYPNERTAEFLAPWNEAAKLQTV